MDEVAIYHSALSASQIQNHYLAGVTSPTNYSSAGVTGGANYKAVILADSALQYYRLDETASMSATLDSAALIGDNALYQGAVTFGSAGVVSDDSAIQSDGSTGYLSSLVPESNSGPFSVETWFKTTTTSGGKLVGFGSQQTGLSASYDRHIYMTNSGTLVFGTNDGSMHTVESSAAYNDGNWHHAVGTLGEQHAELLCRRESRGHHIRWRSELHRLVEDRLRPNPIVAVGTKQRLLCRHN